MHFLNFVQNGRNEPALCSPCNELYFVYWCSGIILCRSQKRRWSRASERILCPPHSSACENFYKLSVTPLTLKVFYPVIFLCWRLQPALYPSSPWGPQGPNSAHAHRTISQDSSATFARRRLTECEWALNLTFLNIISCHDVLFFSCPSIVNESASWFSLIYFPWWSCHL